MKRILLYIPMLILVLLTCTSCSNDVQIRTINHASVNVIMGIKEQFELESNDIILRSIQLSWTPYPEYIYLSENYHIDYLIFSPIDADYNAAEESFIGDAAFVFTDVWNNELEYQYQTLLEHLPEEYKDDFINQQAAWRSYHSGDLFNIIGGKRGWGYIREWYLKRMDRIRSRTIEIMQIQFLLDSELPAFQYERQMREEP